MVEIIPGDPARTMLGLNASDEAVAALRTETQPQPIGRDALSGMDRGAYCKAILGYPTPTAHPDAITLIAERLAITLPLSPLCAHINHRHRPSPSVHLLAPREGTAADRLITLASQFGIAPIPISGSRSC